MSAQISPLVNSKNSVSDSFKGATMKTKTPHLFAGLLTAALALGPGCVDGSGTVSISGALDLNSGGSPFCLPVTPRARGLLDLKSGTGYTGVLSLVDGIPQTASSQVLQQDQTRSPNYPFYGNAEANTVTVQSVNVYIQDERGTDLDLGVNLGKDNPRTVSPGGSVTNTGFAVGSQLPVFIPMVTATEAAALRGYAATVNPGFESDPSARVAIQSVSQIFTRTSGSGFDNTPEFTFPIDLCYGCLVDVGVDFVQDGVAVCKGSTPAAPLTLQQDDTYNPCVPPGQDIVFTKCAPPN